MGLPTRASAAEVLQTIEGKLMEDERELANVQVVTKEAEDRSGVHLQLQNADGVFLDAPPLAKTNDTVGL